ncbi:MAG: tRNA epoxyqueuosine(34) reductase QueG, partial [Myxococcota bacterium]
MRELARQAGFELYGIATLAPASTGAAYERWLERGDQAGMAWMERNRALRHDPRGLLPGARSALVVGLRYAPLAGEQPVPEGSIWPRVARYARGRDYHLVLRTRLERVATALHDELPEARTRVCVDTAPLLERELAARAGLGAVGKNTNLLNPRFGSWFLLGELLTTLDLAPDAPLADLCGDCHLCLDACPTGALPAPYRLDARRCLSYWTIEHRGEIDREYRPHVAERLFGCDICQEVCPWNRREMPPANEPEMRLEGARRELDLAGLLGLTPAAYRDGFRGSAMERARRDGLRRNAAYALAGDPGEAGLA